jgi:hypothetical protein
MTQSFHTNERSRIKELLIWASMVATSWILHLVGGCHDEAKSTENSP